MKRKLRPWQRDLFALRACEAALGWVLKYHTLEAAWLACERPDWMLWLLAKTVKDSQRGRRSMVKIACKFARLALPFTGGYEEKTTASIAVAERWAEGEAGLTEKELSQAASSVYAYSPWASASSAISAAAAAISAARERSTSLAAGGAMDAAAHALRAASYAGSARLKLEKSCCAIIRRHYRKPPKLSVAKRDAGLNFD